MSISVHRERAHRFGAGFRGFDPGPDPAGSPKRFFICGTLLSFVSAAIMMLFLIATLSDARAQDQLNILNRGDAVVTGFSGIKPADAPLPPGGSPLDEFFIDLDGPSAQILSFAAAGGAPNGQLMSAPALLQIKAREVGQVFATALDDGLGADVPNIYLGQTAAYGLHIVLPDADGDGWAERTKKGAPGAEWMGGQFGMATGGGPGAIYKVDGKTGVISLFASLPENSGAGVGDIVFDTATRQFFASDLDSGLIYRLNETGGVIDSFDHGVTGRPEDELAEIADDGSTVDIENAAFDSEDPETWGFTQDERRVHGLAIRDDRLFYAVDGKVWSVGISEEGFTDDVRWELDAEALESDGPVTDMLFDGEGRLYLAQRGGQRASYDYSVFAEPEKSSVVRYRMEDPDDPATESVWVAEPEDYAIGLPPEHRHAEGGIALGYSHDATGLLRYGSCGQMLWSTGHRLRPSAFAGEVAGETEPDADVHGLQGNAVSLVRPENVPPQQSYFADYDGFFGDAAKSGHMGDVEIWQPCEGGAPSFGQFPPGIFTPGDTPPDDLPPEFPPEYEYETNLELTKWASPKECHPWFGGWLCQYRIRVRNTGPDDYFGPVLIEDFLPANPAGAGMAFEPTPPWTCWNTGPSAHKCFRAGVFLVPGASIGLKAYAWVPKDYGKCNLRNVAAIELAPGGTQWNTDPFDDVDSGNALIPSEECENPDEETDLKIYKRALLDCFQHDGGLRCGYRVTVENQGPGAYNGDIVVEDVIPAGTTAVFSGPAGTWDNCPKVAGIHTCTYANASLPNPGDSTSFTVRVDLSHAKAKQLNCRVRNRVRITQAPGDTPMNTDPTNDTASAVANVPEELCTEEPEKTDLKIYKRAYSCYRVDDHLRCAYRVTVRNMGPSAYSGDIKVEDTIPPGTTGIFSDGIGNWDNCPNAGNIHTCTLANANLPVNGIATFNVRVDFTREQAREMHCRIRNHVKITEAPGSSPKNTNPGNDTADAVGTVPSEFCVTPRRSNLKIEKKANPEFCSRSGNGYWCRYAIRVINTGPNAYAGPIEVEEALPAEPLNANWNVPWSCAGIGGGGGAICKHPFTVIPVNHSRILFLNVKFSEDVVKEKNCVLPNVAKITVAPGGSPRNTNPNDDISGDSAKVDPRVCEKEETNLLLMKQGAQPECNTTGGGLYRCPYNVIVRNIGGGKYDGPITVRDYLPPAASGATMQVPLPWNCIGVAPSIICKHPAVQLDPGQQVVMPVNVLLPPAGYGECALTNTAMILQAPGGSTQNKIVGDDEDSATLQFPPLLVPGGPAYCNPPVPVKPCPPGYDWNGERCERTGTPPPPPPPPPGRDCPAGFTGKYPDCDRIVTPQPDPECPRGYVGTPPNCRRIVQPDPTPECTGGRVLRGGECVCRRGRVWNGQRCVRPQPRTCPKGYVGTPPNCRKIVRPTPTCPKGYVGRPPNCRKIVRPTPTCPKGYVGRPPNCRKIVRPTPTCPKGYVGRPPNCRKLQIRKPQVRPLRCPRGTVGTPPNCRKVQLQVPRQQLNPNRGNTIR